MSSKVCQLSTVEHLEGGGERRCWHDGGLGANNYRRDVVLLEMTSAMGGATIWSVGSIYPPAPKPSLLPGSMMTHKPILKIWKGTRGFGRARQA